MENNAANEVLGTSINLIFSFINIFKISSNVSEFRRWLKEYHKLEDDSKIFKGYRFFLDTCVRGFIDSIILDTSLDLNEAFTFFRARFVGIEIEDIPNICEKTIFIKNVWKLTRTLRKAQGWEELTAALADASLLCHVFDKIFERAISPTRGSNKENALKNATIFTTHVYLNDTNRGVPQAYLLPPILKYSASGDYLETVYAGYVYALQYLWFISLGKEKFENSPLKDLHNAHEIYSKEAEEQIESHAGIPVSEEEIKKEYVMEKDGKINWEGKPKHEGEILLVEKFSPEDCKNTEAEKERLNKLKNWFALDMFFGKIQDEIITPLEGKLGFDPTFKPLLRIADNFNKSYVNELLKKEDVEEPEYFEEGNNKNLIKKKLDYLFLWYDVNVLDTQRLTEFNGVPAFISTLIGNVELSRIFSGGEKVFALRFKHPKFRDPVTGAQGYDYSYGILNQVFGSFGLTDYSGWLIFFDCATDYSGFGGSLHRYAEEFIKKFLEKEKIEIGEYIVSKGIFKEYLAEKSTSSVFDKIKRMTPEGVYMELSISEIQRKAEYFIGDAKGKFFEYLFFNWLTEEMRDKYKNIKCDVLEKGEQIDVVAEKVNEIHIFECKVNLHGDEISKTVKQMERKVEAVQQYGKKIIPRLVFFSQIQRPQKEQFENAGIEVFESFKEKVENWKKLSGGERKKILAILNYRFEETIHS